MDFKSLVSTIPPSRQTIILKFECKGSANWAKYKTKHRVFCFYFRNAAYYHQRWKVRISEWKTKYIWVFLRTNRNSTEQNLFFSGRNVFFSVRNFFFSVRKLFFSVRKNMAFNLVVRLLIRIFAAETWLSHLGLTGFDSRMRWYVSMRSEDCVLHNQAGRKINWQQWVCSRCLIEV